MNAKKRLAAVRVSLDMSPEANDLLESLASLHGTTKSQILRRAVALYHVASEASASGNRLAVVDKDKKVVSEIVGL
jgi:hypothetical protein